MRADCNDSGGDQNFRFFEYTEQQITLNDQYQKVVTLRDVTTTRQNSLLLHQKNLAQLVSASCNHEFLAPLRCMIEIIGNMKANALEEDNFNLSVLHNTAFLLLGTVQ